jgi:hypothetical protein
MVRETFESMNPASPITEPATTRARPEPCVMAVMRSSPATTIKRVAAPVALVPKCVASLPAAGAATTAERVMGRKRSPAASGPWPSTTWK